MSAPNTMASFFRHSLLQRLGLLMATITVMAVTSMVISVIIAEMLEGHAAAINQAGTLRMQSYLILGRALATNGPSDTSGHDALRMAEREFEARLISPRLTNVLPSPSATSVRRRYDEIHAAWTRTLRPLLAEYARASTSRAGQPDRLRGRLATEIDAFVLRIDAFVGLLEQGAESKIRMLRAIQAVSLFLTLAVVFLTMYFMQIDVVVPLNDLLGCAAQVRHGDFERRAVHVGGDELGRLGQAFNVMAADLSKLYADLEARVAERTAELHRSNRALELLYHTSSRLGADPLSPRAYRELLTEMQGVLGMEAGVVCLATPGRNEGRLQASTLPGDASPPSCTAPDCGTCLAGQGPPLSPGQHRGAGQPGLLTLPLGDPEAREGVMTLSLGSGRGFEPWQRRLGEAVARQASMALANARRNVDARRVALLEERGALARELHDSLAQSLSYLKIQVTRLEAAAGSGADPQRAWAIIGELRQGLNGAYQQLRELLTTFRIQIDGRGLAQALEDTVREYQARTEIEIRLDNRLHGCTLEPNEEIHVLQIVREALANVVRHSRARRSRVTLACARDREVEVVVEDDGVGMAAATGRRHHYGLSIMRERAGSLVGRLDFDTGPRAAGTRVTLRFTPASMRAEATRITNLPA